MVQRSRGQPTFLKGQMTSGSDFAGRVVSATAAHSVLPLQRESGSGWYVHGYARKLVKLWFQKLAAGGLALRLQFVTPR